MRMQNCRHFTGIMAKKCAVGVTYVAPLTSCIGKQGYCEKFSPYTQQEIEEDKKITDHEIDCLKRNVSSCCEASIDTSQVIKNGSHKGHGPRFCSKCHKCVFMV